jgi:hypothetical protein
MRSKFSPRPGNTTCHPPEAAATFFNAVKIGEALGQQRITGTRAIPALTEIGKSDTRGGTSFEKNAGYFRQIDAFWGMNLP